MVAASGPAGLILPRREIILPRIEVPRLGAALLRHPLKRWRTRTAEDALTAAVAIDQQLGSATSGTGVGATTIAFNTANPVASGGFIVLLVGFFGGGTVTGMGVTGGLTWTVQASQKNGANITVAQLWAQAPAGLASGTNLSASLSANGTSRGIAGVSFTGIATSSPVDTSNAATGSVAAWNAGSLVTTNADDLLVGVAIGDAGSDTTSTPDAGNGYIEAPATAGDFNTAGNGDSFSIVYRIVSATGTYAPAGTWGIATTWAGVSVAYKAAAGGAVALPPSSRRGRGFRRSSPRAVFAR